MKRLPFRLPSLAQGTPRRLERVWRWMFNFATALSLLLLCAVTALCIRSYWTAEAVGFSRRVPAPAARIVYSSNGFIAYRHLMHPPDSRWVYQSPGWVYQHGPTQAWEDLGSNVYRFLGVTYADNTFNHGLLNGTREIAVRVPYWLLLAATGALPITRLLSRRHRLRAMRAAAGLCPICGYDLRATPERCPECGTLAEQRSDVRGQKSEPPTASGMG